MDGEYKMTEENYNYTVKCRTCRKRFEVQLFDSREKALFLVDKKDWYCDKCKKAYLEKKAADLSKTSQGLGFPALEGSRKMVSWGEKIRSDLIGKVNYLRQNLRFETEKEQELSEKALEIFFKEWQEKNAAKWWIDNRNMTVRDMSARIEEILNSMT